MGRDTGITWTDHTFNPWWGCTRVSAGCERCYAESFANRLGARLWGSGVPRRTFGVKHWQEPLLWNRQAAAEGRKHFVFCGSMCDVMDEEAPAGERARLWPLIDHTPYLIWQLLTKRPEGFARWLPKFEHGNVILMATAENQEVYNLRWPLLRDAADRRGLQTGISYEPALGPLSIAGFDSAPDWLIFGGESGAGRRVMVHEAENAAKILFECTMLGVRFFIKQMSARTPAEGKALIPANLLVQEMPVLE
jgi:protein gp37